MTEYEPPVGSGEGPAGQGAVTYLRVLDVATGKPVLPPIRASGNYADSVNWSSDGTRLVTAGNDGTVRLYDASSGQQIGTSLPVSGTASPYATFSPTGG